MGGVAIDDDVIEGMIQAGAPPDRIEEARTARREDEAFEVWPDTWAAVIFFAGLGTQWRISSTGKAYGMDYAAAEAAMRISRIPRRKWRGLFRDVRIMEAAAIDYIQSAGAEKSGDDGFSKRKNQ